MILKKRNKFWRLWLRLKVAYKVVFKHKHGVCIFITEDQLSELIQTDQITTEMKMSYYGMMEHQAFYLIKDIASYTDDVDLVCSKAQFEAEVETIIKKKH